MTRRRLALREIHGNVTVTRDKLTAWYVMGPQRWSFTSEAKRETLVTAYASTVAKLSGHRIHVRVSAMPYPAKQWAADLWANSPDRLPGWDEAQLEVQKGLASATLAEKVAFFGVDLNVKRGTGGRTKSYLSGWDGARAEVEKHADELGRIGGIVAAPGMDARPATTDEVAWLMHRSVRLGLPAPSTAGTVDAPWLSEDVHAFTDGMTYRHARFSPTVEVSADYNGKVVTRHVAVLAVGRMGAFKFPHPSRDPWMQVTDRLGFPVEWTYTGDVVSGAKVAKSIERVRLRIRDQQAHFREHDIEEPDSLEGRARLAKKVEGEVIEGDPVTATRVYGWPRLAVSGATERECIERVKAVTDLFEGQQVTILHPRNLRDGAAQGPLMGEFSPGEGVSTTAYRRDLPMLMFAASMPHVSASLGDRSGPAMGHTAGSSRRAFMVDPHRPMEHRDKSGLITVVGEPGAGKSILVSKFGYWSARRGIVTTILDPSGPLANLCALPELAPHARHLDLVRGEEGSLNPYAVIRDPLRENYDTDDEWEAAQVARVVDRKGLATDIIRMLLPPQIVKSKDAPSVVSDAIRAVGGERDKSLWNVVKAMEKQGTGAARNIANLLHDAAEMPQSRLFFPNHVYDLDVPDDTLLVLTMAGLQLPPAKLPREAWSTAQLMSVPVLHLASFYTSERAYGLPKHQRKMVALDEVKQMAEWGSGTALFNRLSTDSRKFNIAAIIASQGPQELLDLDIAHLASMSFVGRIEDEKTAGKALRLLRIPTGVGYEAVIGRLSPDPAKPREFIVSDVDKNVDKARIDLTREPELLRALKTTPGQM